MSFFDAGVQNTPAAFVVAVASPALTPAGRGYIEVRAAVGVTRRAVSFLGIERIGTMVAAADILGVCDGFKVARIDTRRCSAKVI